MKLLFLYLLMLTFTSAVLSQNKIGPKTSGISEKDRWNLDKFVWSHSHYQTGNNDKPAIDFDIIDNWIVCDNYDVSITDNGKYFAYTTRYTWNKQWAPDSLVILSTKGSWRQSFSKAKAGFFSADGSQYVFVNKEKLYFVKTGTDQVRSVDEVLGYKKPDGNKVTWIAYQLGNKTVVLKNLINNKEYHFDAISDYYFSSSGTLFICKPNNAQKELILFDFTGGRQKILSSVIDYKTDGEGKAVLFKNVRQDGGTELDYITLSNGSVKTLWSSSNATTILQGYNLDHPGSQVTFSLQTNKGDLITNSIMYWRTGMNCAVEKLNSESKEIDGDFLNPDMLSFSESGHYIKFTLEKKPEILIPKPDAVQLNVWTYFDTVLQSTQLVKADNKKRVIYKAFISVDGGQIIRETREEKLKAESGDYLIMAKKGRDANGDRFWENGYYSDSNWVVSVMEGYRNLLPTNQEWGLMFSPDTKYLVYFDTTQHCYFSYNLQTGKITNICKGVPDGELIDKTSDAAIFDGNLNKRTFGGACWWQDGEFWVYSRYDIWSLDLTGKKTAVNITNGYGRKHNIILRLSGNSWVRTIVKPTFLEKDILLKAQNENNGENGFFSIKRGEAKDPQLLYMAPDLIEQTVFSDGEDMKPLKAAGTAIWIVKKQSATEAPNYFLTKDFKSYKPITNLHPQKNCNWLTSELHHFKQLDGSSGKGILYKPENFDSSKKYPVIVIFYLLLSEKLHVFPEPDYIRSPASALRNPAWLASHGYLVFLPDIDFRNGKWGPSTVNSVEGAARYLSSLPFVDGANIGAAGHSNSGRFGYYLLTHSHAFKAMSIGSGYGGTDILSLSLSIEKEGIQESSLEWAERGSVGKGLGNLWGNKEEWLDHTAVLQADKITTPLLLFHNKLDGDDVRLAVELYTGMRRLGKRIWWLEYDEGRHTVESAKDRRDFTIRYTQFFDHYLKRAPAPLWMNKGIPAKLKGVEERYELDANERVH